MDHYSAWLMCFIGVVGWQLHPRNEGAVDLDASADLVDAMLKKAVERCPGLLERPH